MGDAFLRHHDHPQCRVAPHDIATNIPASEAEPENLGPLVYNLCERRKLPVLVTDLIAGYLDERDILKLSFLSKGLCERAKSITYDNIVLELTEQCCWQRAVLLLRTLLTCPSIRGYVRTLSLIGDPLLQWRKEVIRSGSGQSNEQPLREESPPRSLVELEGFNSKERELYCEANASLKTESMSDSKASLSDVCLGLIKLVRNSLERLEITSDYFRYTVFGESLTSISASGGLPSLRQSSFCLDAVYCKVFRHIEAVEDWDESMLAPISAPNIESMTTVTTLKSDLVRHMATSALTRLTLYHCQVTDFHLSFLLAATPQLRYLEYHAYVDAMWHKRLWSTSRHDMHCRVGLAPLLSALHYVRDSLTELVTSQWFGMDSNSYEWGSTFGAEPPFHMHTELSQLHRLQTLVIPYPTLLGWHAKSRETYAWREMLPPSLRRLTFTDNLCEGCLGGWTDKGLLPVFSDLFAWLGACAQGDWQPAFTLRLHEMEDDFEEPEHGALHQLGEEHGIICTLDKRIPD